MRQHAGMESESQHVSVSIARSADAVYEYASNPANLPQWAAGLTSSTVERVDGQWVAESPMGRIVIDFVPRNDLGVLDHTVTLPSGKSVYNPLRVVPDGNGCEVVFTVRRRPEMSSDDFARDAAAVTADLDELKRIVERQ